MLIYTFGSFKSIKITTIIHTTITGRPLIRLLPLVCVIYVICAGRYGWAKYIANILKYKYNLVVQALGY